MVPTWATKPSLSDYSPKFSLVPTLDVGGAVVALLSDFGT